MANLLGISDEQAKALNEIVNGPPESFGVPRGKLLDPLSSTDPRLNPARVFGPSQGPLGFFMGGAPFKPDPTASRLRNFGALINNMVQALEARRKRNKGNGGGKDGGA